MPKKKPTNPAPAVKAKMPKRTGLSVIELCAGAGGQAIGLHDAGFTNCLAAVEIDESAVATLKSNKLHLNVIPGDVKQFSAKRHLNKVDLLAAGVPCPPFSIAGKQLGADDERDLFPAALARVGECNPKAVLFENVRGFASAKFAGYRRHLQESLWELGYESAYCVLQASDFGVPQLRPRFVLVALKREFKPFFFWPRINSRRVTVAKALSTLMAANGWKGVARWKRLANDIAPTLVGGSKKHGGPDLGPTRAKLRWKELGVNGHGLGNEAPPRDFDKGELPKLTVEMAARIQGFPAWWRFVGGKTAAYRQVGNAFPPPVARAVGAAIYDALKKMSGAEPSLGEAYRRPEWFEPDNHLF